MVEKKIVEKIKQYRSFCMLSIAGWLRVPVINVIQIHLKFYRRILLAAFRSFSIGLVSVILYQEFLNFFCYKNYQRCWFLACIHPCIVEYLKQLVYVPLQVGKKEIIFVASFSPEIKIYLHSPEPENEFHLEWPGL